MSNILKPRPYQQEGLAALKHYYNEGKTRLLGCMATGMGKTSGIAANIPATFPELAEHRNGEGGILFIVHRIEIIRQAYEKFQAMYPDRWIGLEQAENHCTGYEDFIFASVDSIGRLMGDRIFKYKQRKFGIIITDEAHHLSADNTWDNILTYFGVGSDPRTHFRLSNGLKPLHLMLTATPDNSMTPFVDRCPTESGFAFSYDILYGVREGWLVDIRSFKAAPKGERSLDAYEPEEQVDYLIKVYHDLAEGMRTLCFARNVSQSQLLAHTLNVHGMARAGHVDHKETILPPNIILGPNEDPRRALLHAYARGEVDLLTNRLVFTEGWDAPGIQCILDNSPTQSKTLFPQKIGRGLRPAADARVDDYDTAEERRAAIARSSKDALLYITTFDPVAENSLTVVGALWGGREVDAEGHKVVEEVIDVIEKEESERPERPIRDVTSLSELEIELSKVDVWTQTIENPKLQAATPLRWVIQHENGLNHASIYLPRNPRATNDYNDTPVIWHFHQVGEREWQFYEVVVGGWVEKLKRPVKAKVLPGKKTTQLTRMIRALDAAMEANDPDIYADLKRGVNAPATDAQKRYMQNHGIRFGDNVTEETANILIDDFRIKRKMEKITID